MATAVGAQAAVAPALAPDYDLPTEYGKSVLNDARADAGSKPTGSSICAPGYAKLPEIS
ncbi:hypothetical protein [Bradyrhizobium australafricanum]|uniref:hypothetical protein n=1 Tax=Bradyrhizobium australafricanum TaxID=2821406 RepID=UPI001CE33317|nr:hypothetical protein [Bradyrhizobium australafricanum]MCA6098194.1 hypothetical protein [Bradyrhizobium australafricanum]